MEESLKQIEEVLTKSMVDCSRQSLGFTLSDDIDYCEQLEASVPCILDRKKETVSFGEIQEEPSSTYIEETAIKEWTIPQIARAQNKKQLFINKSDILRQGQLKSIYYTMIKMLFPEISGLPPLSINILDTIFYNNDGSMVYVYTDPKRGLLKTKSKNYSELFFRRRSELNLLSSYEVKSPRSDVEAYEYGFLKNYNYVALLRYKDSNFIRLKEDEFRSLFIRPVQANERYKISNNAIYLQMIPDSANYCQNTLFTLQFDLQSHKNSNLFHEATRRQSQQTSFIFDNKNQEFKSFLKKQNFEHYLLYTIFEIYTYIHIHYQKVMEFGVFEFMKIGDQYFLTNMRNIELISNKKIQNQYKNAEIFMNNQYLNSYLEDIDLQDTDSELKRVFQMIFDRQNTKICQKVRNLVKEKLEQIENKQDVEESKRIFESLNAHCRQDFHDFFQNTRKYANFIRNKQNNFDRTSPFSTISNLTVSKSKFKSFQAAQENLKKQPKQSIKHKNPFFQTQKLVKTKKTQKWKLNIKHST